MPLFSPSGFNHFPPFVVVIVIFVGPLVVSLNDVAFVVGCVVVLRVVPVAVILFIVGETPE